mgnify:CR=1 FL=1
MIRDDDRDSGRPEEASSAGAGEEREQILDRSSVESALGGPASGPRTGREYPPDRPPEPESEQAEPAQPTPSEDVSVRLSMEDVERLAIKPPDRASSIPPAGPRDNASVPPEQAGPSTPPDAAALGNTMKALLDSRIAAEPEGEAARTGPPADIDDDPQAADPAFVPPGDEGSNAEPSVSVPLVNLSQPGGGESQPAGAPEERTLAEPEQGTVKATADASTRPARDTRAVAILVLLALTIAVVAWIVVRAWLPIGSEKRAGEPRAASGSRSIARSAERPGGSLNQGAGAAMADENEADEAKARKAKRRSKARRSGASRDGRDRQPVETAIPGKDESRARAPRRSVASLPQVPDRESVKWALKQVYPQIRECAAGKRGVAEVTLTVKNTGRVMHAVVGGDFAGTAEGSCIARAVRKTRLPPFLRPRFTLVYPFSL